MSAGSAGSSLVNAGRLGGAAILVIGLASHVAAAPGQLPAELPAPAAESIGEFPAGQRAFRMFSGADGLKNLMIFSIAQDALGHLWVGTDDGAYRFDGVRFKRFSVEDGLTSNLISAIGTDTAGNLCVGSDNGLACWDGARFSQAATRGLPARRVRAIVSYGDKLWVGLDGGGLYVRGTSGAFIPAPGWPGAPNDTVRALWADANGVVVGNETRVELSSGDGVWRRLGAVGLGDERVDGVVREHDGSLWIRAGARLWMLPRGASRVRDLSEGLPTSYDTGATAAVMALDPRGDVLIATDGGTAHREGDGWRMIDRSPGMPMTGVRTLFVDREGTTWIATAGLLQIRGRGLVEHYSESSGLPGYIAWTFQRDAQGALWVGTNLCAAQALADHWECDPATEGRVVHGIVFPPQGGVFVSGVPADLLYVVGRHAISLHVLPADEGTVHALKLGPDHALWIATSGGLFQLPDAVPGPVQRVVVPGMAADTRFSSLAVVGDQLWTAAAPGGVAVLDRGVWHVFDHRAGLLGDSLRYVVARADGRVCAAYNEAIGLSCFRYSSGAIRDVEHLGRAQGLTSGRVYSFGEDHQQRLWIGTGDGVDVVTPRGIDHFDESDGLVGNDSAGTAVLVDGDGSLWLGATGGVSHVFAQYYAGLPEAPLTALLTGELGPHSLIGAGALEVPHDSNALSVEVAAGTLLEAKRVEYQMRLSPLESEWTTLRERVARYPALPPGSYRFEARARISAGGWGDATVISFAVLPAWWQARWFVALCALAGLAAVGGAFAWRQRMVLDRRVRQMNEQSEASLRAMIDLMPEIISVSREGHVIYRNRAMHRMLGTSPIDDAGPVPLAERLHPDDLPRVEELFRKVATESQEIADVLEVRLRASDGTWRTCDVSAVLVEVGGRPTVVASGRDVTERQRTRAKMLVTDRMASLGTLAAGIAHEINNPLAYVTGNLEAAAEMIDGPALAPSPVRAELAGVIGNARDGAERVRKIVHGLRSFSRAEEESRVPLALPDVLDAAIRLTANEVKHRARLELELGTTPRVIADDSRLTQVFINLLINAAHAIPEGHSDANRIAVRTRTDSEGRAVIEVEDSGLGMSADVQARVFDPFFTTKDVGVGTGLGLSICHGIVTGLGGQITIESAVGLGTIVRIVLPGHAEPVAVEPVVAMSVRIPVIARRHRVMLVDDEPHVAHTMERLLRRDYDVTVALCGQDALDHITGGARFDAIISDVMMPNMTGLELLEQLQQLAPDQAQRLIFLSGGAFTTHTRERLDQIGAPQLSKPIAIKELRSWVMRIAMDPGALTQAVGISVS